MEIEVGGLYRTRGGHIVKVAEYDSTDPKYPYLTRYLRDDWRAAWVSPTGRYWGAPDGPDHPLDLVSRVAPHELQCKNILPGDALSYKPAHGGYPGVVRLS